MIMWSSYSDSDPTNPELAVTDPDAVPGVAPRPAPGLDPVELFVEGERFVVTRRADTPGTYDFDWASHPSSYGFTVGGDAAWTPGREELLDDIRNFLADVDPHTGYLED
jgi:hypothetical protein